MGKPACKKRNFENKENPSYVCKKCDAEVRKKDKVCKPKKIDDYLSNQQADRQ